MTAMLSPDVVPDFDGQQRCRQPGVDPDWFFRDDDLAVAAALGLCMDCPLRRPCLDYARWHAVEGIWGGTTEDERRKWRRSNHVLPAPVVDDDSRPVWQQVMDMHNEGAKGQVIADTLGISRGSAYSIISRYRDGRRVS